jgi:hypothetical protein
MSDQTPEELRDRAAAMRPGNGDRKKKNNATGARIIAAGVSVAAGVGIIGVMAAGAQTTSSPPPPEAVESVIVAQPPDGGGAQAPVALPLAPVETQTVVPDESTQAPAPTPVPVTVTEGS